MKKKVIIAISIVCLTFILGGIYIITTMEIATSRLDHLIVLHRVEILREQLLIHIKKVESDLSLRETPHARGIDTVIANVQDLEKMLGVCFDCHRSAGVLKWINELRNENVLKKLEHMNRDVEAYKDSLSRFLTMRANRERTQVEYNTALETAQRLVTEANAMIHVTSAKLTEKTESSYSDISRIKTILYALVIAAPFFAALLGFIFVREVTKPVKVLLNATRKLKGGDLDYRIGGLEDEFGEVAESFNEMSDSLKQNLLEIRESERRYRTLFESAGDAIFLVEAEGEEPGKIVDANPAAAKMHGYTLDELLKLNLIKDLDGPDAAAQAPERLRRILSGEWVHAELDHRKKDGTIFPVEVSAGLLEYMGHKYIFAVDRDISDRKKLQNEILQSKLDWEDTFNTITDIITIHDKDFNIIRANRAARKILKLRPSEIGKAKCYFYYHGQDRPPEDCLSCQCLVTGKPAAFETFEPHLGKYMELRAMPRFDSHNQMIGCIHVVRDISERKRVEEALQRTEQMKMVGELATGLAHEIKNPLAGIKASVEVLADEVDLSEEDRAIIMQAVEEIRRIEILLKSLLEFAKPPKPKPSVVDVNDILDKTITFALKHPSFSSNPAAPIKASKDFEKALPEILADPMQLEQAFLNLLINAIEAMSDGGTLGLKTSYDPVHHSIELVISDTGQGIEGKALENIFQPFFTTKQKGTGLGLPITRRLIEQNGGSIHVESQPGKGTIFRIFFLVNEVKKEKVA